MSNGTTVSVTITAPTTLFITAVVYASNSQQLAIVPQPPLQIETMAASGSGVANQINNWSIELQPGTYEFALVLQYDTPAGLIDCATVTQTSSSAGTLNQVVVLAQDTGPSDPNCSVLTFSWFNTGS